MWVMKMGLFSVSSGERETLESRCSLSHEVFNSLKIQPEKRHVFFTLNLKAGNNGSKQLSANFQVFYKPARLQTGM